MSMGRTTPLACRAGSRFAKITTAKMPSPLMPVFARPIARAAITASPHCHGSRFMQRQGFR